MDSNKHKHIQSIRLEPCGKQNHAQIYVKTGCGAVLFDLFTLWKYTASSIELESTFLCTEISFIRHVYDNHHNPNEMKTGPQTALGDYSSFKYLFRQMSKNYMLKIGWAQNAQVNNKSYTIYKYNCLIQIRFFFSPLESGGKWLCAWYGFTWFPLPVVNENENIVLYYLRLVVARIQMSP